MRHNRDHWNAPRFPIGSKGGHYESWFQRANHPRRPVGFWVRYTQYVPASKTGPGLGELWAVYFDGETRSISALKKEVPLTECAFEPGGLHVSIGTATLSGHTLKGAICAPGGGMHWNLSYTSPTEPLLLLPESMYTAPVPKAKALVGSPSAVFNGTLRIGDEEVDVGGWVGSQNHNWGSKHTDAYAWGQVAGFEDEPGAFFEIGTAKLKLGPVWTPKMTVMALRLDGEDHHLSSIPQSLKAKGSYEYFRWKFHSANRDLSIQGTLTGERSSFIALPYKNPPGGVKTCLNSKIARCELRVTKNGQPPRRLVSENRAAFEIGTDDGGHGVPMMPIKRGIGVLGLGRFKRSPA